LVDLYFSEGLFLAAVSKTIIEVAAATTSLSSSFRHWPIILGGGEQSLLEKYFDSARKKTA